MHEPQKTLGTIICVTSAMDFGAMGKHCLHDNVCGSSVILMLRRVITETRVYSVEVRHISRRPTNGMKGWSKHTLEPLWIFLTRCGYFWVPNGESKGESFASGTYHYGMGTDPRLLNMYCSQPRDPWALRDEMT